MLGFKFDILISIPNEHTNNKINHLPCKCHKKFLNRKDTQ